MTTMNGIKQESTISTDYSDELRARDTIIEKTKRSIIATTEHLRNSVVMVPLPLTNIPDDSSQRRMEELQEEVQTHLKTTAYSLQKIPSLGNLDWFLLRA
ncbi:unnamed protein product, partial [Didymodactylos carnosus]